MNPHRHDGGVALAAHSLLSAMLCCAAAADDDARKKSFFGWWKMLKIPRHCERSSKPSNCKLMSSKLISLYTFFSVLALPHRWLSTSTAPRESHQKSGGVEVCEKPLIVLEKLCSFSAPDFVPLILSFHSRHSTQNRFFILLQGVTFTTS